MSSTLRCIAALLIASAAWADLPRAEVRQNEVWFVSDDQQKQLTHDGKSKLQAVLSPVQDRAAYYEACPQAERCTPSVVILDLSGKRLQSFQPRSTAMPNSPPCASILNISWLLNGRIAVECHLNPSASEYIETDLVTGKNVKDLFGLGFTPSWDSKLIAHVGPIIHFAPRNAQSYYLLIDDTIVYPLPKGGKPTVQKPSEQPLDVVQQRGNRYVGIHEFIPHFAWSPDSSRVAFVDCTFDWIEKSGGADNTTPPGNETNRRCALAIVALNGSFSVFPLPDVPLTSINAVEVSWQDNRHAKLSFGTTKTFEVH